jgi:hypothetical protein
MNKQQINNALKKQGHDNKENIELPGYPFYPSTEDVFNKHKIIDDIEPENSSEPKKSTKTENGLKRDKSTTDLDVPGSELDDESEAIGHEDEENNYYSLGGDDHNDLEEDNGE